MLFDGKDLSGWTTAKGAPARVRNVMLAVDLARHSADGWTDAALPDDYARIADLLRVRPEEVKAMVGALDVSPGE